MKGLLEVINNKAVLVDQHGNKFYLKLQDQQRALQYFNEHKSCLLEFELDEHTEPVVDWNKYDISRGREECRRKGTHEL